MKQRAESMIRKTRSKQNPSKAVKRKKELKKNEYNVRNLWENMRHNNICIMGIPEGEEK